MKIAIDISQIVYGTGVSVYTKNLVENILKLDKENEYLLFGGAFRRKNDLDSFLRNLKNKSLQTKIFPLSPSTSHIIWNKIHLISIDILIGKVDVYHSSDWTQPSTRAFKVTTVHDLVPLKYPKLSHPKIVSNQNIRFKWIKKEVDRVIVPSISTANDVSSFGIEKEKIRVVPEAVDPNIKYVKRKDTESVRRKYRISGKYLIAIGVNPRKNTDRIIKAYEKIKGELNIKLIVVGEVFSKVSDIRGVYYLGHVSTGDLASLYSGAEALVYPSLYEGFGLPILEAFSCKTPVVTSNFGSMAEVAGNAAVLIDPYGVQSIAEGILKAFKNKEKLVKKGLKRIKIFSWQKTAKKTLSVYMESNYK